MSKLSSWNLRRMRIISATYILFGVIWFTYIFVVPPIPFAKKHLMFWGAPGAFFVLAGTFLFFFAADPDNLDEFVGLVLRAGYVVSEEERERWRRSREDWNRVFTVAVTVFTVFSLAHTYFVDSLRLVPVDAAHVYGFVTYMFPMLLIIVLVYWYLKRKYPDVNRLVEIAVKQRRKEREERKRS